MFQTTNQKPERECHKICQNLSESVKMIQQFWHESVSVGHILDDILVLTILHRRGSSKFSGNSGRIVIYKNGVLACK